MAYAAINVRVSAEDKRDFEIFCQNTGMNISVAINMFIKAVLGQGRLPFEVCDRTPNAETRRTLDAIMDGTEPLSKPYASTEELMKDLLSD